MAKYDNVVREGFNLMLGRDPSAEDLAFYNTRVAELRNELGGDGEAAYAAFRNELGDSEEFANRITPILNKGYQDVLGRDAEAEAIPNMVEYAKNGLLDGKTVEGMTEQFYSDLYGSQEYDDLMNPGYTKVVAGDEDFSWQQNIGDFSSDLINDPNVLYTDNLSDRATNLAIDPETTGTGIDADATKYNMDLDGLNIEAETVGSDYKTADVTKSIDTPATYDVETTYDSVIDPRNQAVGVQGTVSEGAIIDADETPQIDVEETAQGLNETGKALDAYASLSTANVIDTSTLSGKLLAQTLGEGNYVDTKSTLKGQLDILSAEFVDSAGNTKIPTWAAGQARAVKSLLGSSGITGSAAEAAIAQAIMEASIPVAQQDSQFFSTVQLTNLSNKQQSTINKANVLSKMELANLDARLTAVVQNSKNFMQMDLTNVANEQQAMLVNTQNRVQSILTDANAENVKRAFDAKTQNDVDMYYDNLNTQISQFNALQYNTIKQFDVSQTNAVNKFNAELESMREQYYRTQQYNIDVFNAKWRQEVETTNNANDFKAAAVDVANTLNIQSEAMNQIWDRADQLLDYLWKDTLTERQMAHDLVKIKLTGQIESDIKDDEGWGKLLGIGLDAALSSKAAKSAINTGVDTVLGWVGL